MSLRYLVLQLASLVCYATMALGAVDPSAGEAETRFLSLIGLLSFESTIENVRSLVPELTELHAQGGGNTNSSFPVQLFGIEMTASFSFHDGKLVSHGVSQRALKKAAALRIYQSVRRHLLRQYGQTSESRVPLQEAHRGFARSTNWTVNGKVVGVYCEKIYDGYQVGWGAQLAR